MKTDKDWIDLKNDALKNNYKPGAIVELQYGYPSPVQLVSYPYFASDDASSASIMVRLTPGNPSTLRELPYPVLANFVKMEDL